MDEFVRVMKSLSDSNRVKIIKILHQRSLCVCEIQAALGVSQPTASSHIKDLEEAGLVTSRKEGRWVNYHPADGSSSPYAALLLASLRHWLNDDPEICDLIATLPFIHRDNLCKK
ncbi:MAG: metalloregulator ArsR/SmtB family transcription factor [Syntrophobacteraceae bacterium]|jgi:ArsR family transcriptional regulator